MLGTTLFGLQMFVKMSKMCWEKATKYPLQICRSTKKTPLRIYARKVVAGVKTVCQVKGRESRKVAHSPTQIFVDQ